MDRASPNPASPRGVSGRAAEPVPPGARRVILAPFPRQVLPDPRAFERILLPNARAGRALGLARRYSTHGLGRSHATPGLARPHATHGLARPHSTHSLARPHATLDRSAELLLRDAGWGRATELQARRCLRRAVREALDPADLEGTVRVYGPTVREVLRAGVGNAVGSQYAVGPRCAGGPKGAGGPRDAAGPKNASEPTASLGAESTSPAGAELSARARGVLAVTERYRALLGELGRVDGAELLWAAAESVGARERLLVAGFPRLGRDELAFLDAFAGSGSVLVLPWSAGSTRFGANEEAAEYLSGRGWQVERPEPTAARLGERLALRLVGGGGEAGGAGGSGHVGVGGAGERGTASGAGSAAGPIRALRLPNQEDEVRFVLTEVKALLRAGVSAGSIVLISRDEALYGPLLRAVAAEYGVPVKLSYAVPLRDTRLGSWLADLNECLRGGLPFEATARLLAHPLAQALGAEGWATARKNHPRGLAAWQAITTSAEALAWPARAERAEYRDLLERARLELGVTAALERADPDALERRADRKLRVALEELAREPGVVPLVTFLTELSDLLALLSVTADPPGSRGVELHTPLAVFGARYRHAFVLGLAEGLLPAAVQDDPVLDFFERARLRRLGLPLESAAEAAEREQLSLWAALETVDAELTLTYPELAGGSERLPSPAFAALGLTPRPPGPKPPASLMEARGYWLRAAEDQAAPDPVLPGARRAWAVERRRESGEAWDEFDGIVGVPLDPASWPFSASQLVTLGQCAYRWFAERRLRLSEPDEAEEEISPLKRGRIYHLALEIALSHAKDAPNPREAALARLEGAFAEAEAEEGAPSHPAWPLRRPRHLEELRRTLMAEDFFTPDGRILSLEGRFEGEWRGLRVHGVVDRVDQGPEGLVLFDYKTRATRPAGAKDASGKATLDVQLPLYVETAAALLHPGEEVAGARYYSLTKARGIGEAKVDGAALDALVERISGYLARGEYAVDPDVDGKVCGHCAFDLACRRGPRLERKRHREAPRGAPRGTGGAE